MSDKEFIDQFDTKKDYDRTLFISGLCVMTWIGCWFTVMYYGMHIFKISDVERSIYHFDEWKLEYDQMKVSVIAPFFSTLGAYFVWHMRRFGIYIYAFGQLSAAVFGLYIYIVQKEIENPVSYYYIAYFGVQILFIIPYALNWKILR